MPLQEELHRALSNYRQGAPLGPRREEPSSPPQVDWLPALDVSETPEAVVIWVDLPGVDPASIDLSVTGKVLTLRGLKPKAEPGPEGPGTVERPAGSFFRRVELPFDVEVDAVEASAQHGVLTIRLPKSAAQRPRTIPIQGGDG